MRKVITILLILAIISISYSYNGFCFSPKIMGKTFNNWSNSSLNLTIKIESKYQENKSYCMTNESEVIIESNGEFNFSGILAASPSDHCLLKVESRKLGYLKYETLLNITSNHTKYNLNIGLKPNTKIKFLEFGTNNSISGSAYINGKNYTIKNGEVEFPLNESILYVFYNGDKTHDKLSKFFSIDYLWKENIVNIYIYRKPKLEIKLLQDKNITNTGKEVNVKVIIKNDQKYSAPFNLSYSISGCGINDNKSIENENVINYKINPNKNCTINLKYKFIDLISGDGKSDVISIKHEVTDKLIIKYWVKGGYIYARVFDVNGNPINTNLTLSYNGEEIKMKEKDGVYYSKIPGNNFEIVANKTKVKITGNFIKKSKIDPKVIVAEVILGAITIFWIYKSRVIKSRK